MGKNLQDTIPRYLEYFVSHLIIISDHLKKNKINDEDFSMLRQYLEEMEENLEQIITILDKKGDLYKGLEGEDPIKIIRDFKIGRIMDERDR